MKNTRIQKILFAVRLSALALLLLSACRRNENVQLSLKDAVGGQFLIGSALNTSQIIGTDTAAIRLLKQHFNSAVAENCMKCAFIHPEEDRYNFDLADAFVAFCEENDMAAIGHCLIWHSQCAPWFFTDKEGKTVSPEVLKQRMKEHIATVVGRYKGRVKGWDVVNEAILEDGTYRRSLFYEILGEEFIPLAFGYAHEADPDAELYYNDYGMTATGRREAVVRLVRDLKSRGLRIDGVGMQGHMDMTLPVLEDFEQSIEAFAAAGVNVMITEWDMSALPSAGYSANITDTTAFRQSLNPYVEGLPDSVAVQWNARMNSFFRLFQKHADVITRVTVWGLCDRESWRNNFPVRGRTDYPVLFDRNHEPKAFVRELCREK